MVNDNDVEIDEGGSDGPPLKLIAFLVVAAALAVFVVQNDAKAPIKFLWIDTNQYVWLIIVISAAAGAILTKLGGWMWGRRRSRRTRD